LAGGVKLLTVEEARARMLAAAAPLVAEQVVLDLAVGRVLAEPVTALRNQPPFAASAMDGWAVRAADAPGRLAIIGESAAGHAFTGPVGKGEAVRIFTGAPVPAGADAIVIQEDASRTGEAVTVPEVESGRHVRDAGMDFRAGQTLLPPGLRLDPWRLALAAAAGLAEVEVVRRPRVAILATGEEIVAPGARARPDQIFDSGTTATTALVRAFGGEPLPLPRVGDDEAAIAVAVDSARCDLVVTLGGASVGDHDLVKPALGRLGLELAVESVAVRPGKPTWFGRLADGRCVLGLPGNPASALVCAELFLRPLIARYIGADPVLPMATARAGAALPANGPREHWMRARLSHGADGGATATPFPDQDSSLVAVFAAADLLLRRPAGAPPAEPGATVEILPLARL
jgi:molybdopterin molybdotransferase